MAGIVHSVRCFVAAFAAYSQAISMSQHEFAFPSFVWVNNHLRLSKPHLIHRFIRLNCCRFGASTVVL